MPVLTATRAEYEALVEEHGVFPWQSVTVVIADDEQERNRQRDEETFEYCSNFDPDRERFNCRA